MDDVNLKESLNLLNRSDILFDLSKLNQRLLRMACMSIGNKDWVDIATGVGECLKSINKMIVIVEEKMFIKTKGQNGKTIIEVKKKGGETK